MRTKKVRTLAVVYCTVETKHNNINKISLKSKIKQNFKLIKWSMRVINNQCRAFTYLN